MSEIDYYAALGLSVNEEAADPQPSEAQGENEQEAAEPVDQDIEETSEETEVIEVTEEVTEETKEESEESDSEKVDKTSEKVDKQTSEENAKYAAARRKAEAEKEAEIKRIRQEFEEEKKRIEEETIAKIQPNNPYTNKPIKTKEDLDEYNIQLQAEKLGVDVDDLKQILEVHPDVLKAKQREEQARLILDKAEQEAAKAQMEAEFKELQKIDPSIKSIDQLRQLDCFPEILKELEIGRTLAKAYEIVNMDKFTEAKIAAAQRAAINKANSKDHLQQIKGKGKPSMIPVPKDVADYYRLFNPSATDAEIQKHYNQNRKE